MCTAIVLSGGSGKRMGGSTAKQYMEIGGKPLIYYTLKAFEESFIQEIILVCRKQDSAYCAQEIVAKYGFSKVKKIVEGGRERLHSVYAGLCCASPCDYVFIHDGARPCITKEILERCRRDVMEYGACVAAVPVKDTIKIADEDGFAVSTPQRRLVWQIQTPQVFEYGLVKAAYDSMLEKNEIEDITDDAMVVEKFGKGRIKMTKGSYTNVKVTTPEDLVLLEKLLKNS